MGPLKCYVLCDSMPVNLIGIWDTAQWYRWQESQTQIQSRVFSDELLVLLLRKALSEPSWGLAGLPEIVTYWRPASVSFSKLDIERQQ